MSKIKKALDKAKMDRETGDDIFPEWQEEQVKETDSPRNTQHSQEKVRREVNFTYTNTRVLNVNPSVLRENKIVSMYGNDEITDQIKILRTELLKQMEGLKGKTIMVTSSNRGEGKTIMAVNLAVSIAQELDRTVLLVDANLRDPAVHTCFGIDDLPGLSDYLKEEVPIQELLVNPGINKLTVLPAGKPVMDSSELLGSPRMEELVTDMKLRYEDRVIIFDTPSLLTSADPLALSKFVDGVLMVVEAERTSREDLRRAIELLEGNRILGTVFNKVRE